MLKKITLFFAFLLFAGNAYCLNLDETKAYLIKGDHKSAIAQGEKILAGYTGHHDNLDELYYLLGLAYLKDGNYLRASDIFEIILKEFRASEFRERAEMGLGDSYFLQGEYNEAQKCYRSTLEGDPRTKLAPLLYQRLSQSALKQGDTAQAKLYLDKLKADFPHSLEVRLDKDIYSLADIYYSVQVGSFVNLSNARNLRDKLAAKGYDAYLQEADMNGIRTYRVRVGKLKSLREAEGLRGRLSSEGHPTKIVP